MKILLTGGTGFIGQNIIKKLYAEHEFVIPTSRTDVTSLVHFDSVNYKYSDYSYNSFCVLLKTCDAVIHAGATQAHQIDNMTSYIDNITISDALFFACVKENIRNIINISSCSVYDFKLNNLHINEESPLRPKDFYAISKLCVENVATLYNSKYDLNIKTLRLPVVLGAFDYRTKLLRTIFINNAILGKQLCIWGDENKCTSYIYINDLIDAMHKLLQHQELRGIFNVGMSEAVSVKQFAEAACNVFNNKKGYVIDRSKPSGPTWGSDVSKIKREIGFECQYNMEDALTDIKRIYESKL